MIESLESVARFVFAVLITGLWQGALLAGVAWLVLRFALSMNATTRHAVLASTLFACLALPVVTVALTFETTGARPVAASAPAQPARRMVETIAKAGSAEHVTTAYPAQVQTHAQPVPAGLPAFVRTRFVLPRALVLAFASLWLLGALGVLARLVVSLVHLERLKRDALPLPVEYRQRLDRWAGAAKGSREVRLCRSNEIVIPIAIGLFDAMILVPEQLVDELAPQDVDRILLHELAHLRRADDWFNALERIAQALLFFNPSVLWIVKQLDLEREVACDDWVLAQTDEPLPYASCLAKVAEVTMWPYRAMAAPGAFVTRKSMSIRIERLLAVHRDVRIRLSYGPVGTAIVALVALCIGAAYVAPSIAYPRSAIAAPLQPTHVQVARKAPAAKGAAVPKPPAVKAPAARPSVAKPAEQNPSVAPSGVALVATLVRVHVARHLDTQLSTSVGEPARTPETVADTTARASYIDELAGAGYTNLSLDDLVELKSLGVTADYIRSLAAVGFSHPAVRELVEARSLGVTADYIRGLRAYFGSTAFTLREAGEVRSLGVTPGYASDLAAAGYPNLRVHDLEEAKSLGTDATFVRRAADHGFHNLTLEQLVRLKVSGIL